MQRGADVVRRMTDVGVALGGLALLAPFLPLIALIIALETGRGPFTTCWRVGFDRRRRAGAGLAPGRRVHDAGGVLFRLVTFRVLGDRLRTRGRRPGEHPQLTSLGRVLRRSGLEAWPSLWNVLRGDLTLVGPRAAPVRFLNRLARACPAWCARLTAVRPGLVHGRSRSGPGRSSFYVELAERMLHGPALTDPVGAAARGAEQRILAGLAGWIPRRSPPVVGNEFVRLDYPASFGQVALNPLTLARRAPADVGAEVLEGDAGPVGFWYPPRRAQAPRLRAPRPLLGDLGEGLELAVGDRTARLDLPLRHGSGSTSDLVQIELPSDLQELDAVCEHLEPLWDALQPRSLHEQLPVRGAVLVMGLLGSLRAGPEERLALTLAVGRDALEIEAEVVAGPASGTPASRLPGAARLAGSTA